MSKRWDEIKNDLFKLANEQDREKLHAELETWVCYIEKLEEENKYLKEKLDNHACGFCKDTIVGVSHYPKYDGRFTFFEQGLNWGELDLSDYESYREFSMHLVYLLTQARKKFEEQSSGKRQQSACFDTCVKE